MKKWMIAFIFIMLTVSVSAEIILDQPQSLYSFGDELDLDVTLKPSSVASDFLKINIYCGNTSYDLYRNYFNLDAGEEAKAEVNFLFGNSLNLKDQDECYLRAFFEDEEIESQRFEVSRKITLGVDTAKKIYEPGENIDITGNANKVSGGPVNGFVSLEVFPLGLSFKGLVEEGKFNLSFRVPENYSGSQELKFNVYEKDKNDEVTNKGEIRKGVVFRPVLKDIRIVLEDDKVVPGDSVRYKIELIDQAGNVMQGDLAVGIFRPDGYNLVQEVRQSGEENEFHTKTNYSAGYWKIQATSGEIEKNELLYVAEKENLVFNLENGTLFVLNSGNVPFVGPIEISIGGTKDVRQVNLDAGEGKRYGLQAPDGDYQVGIKRGQEEFSFGAVSLTGNAISVGEIREGFEIVQGNMVIWVFLVLVVGLVVMLFVYRNRFMTSIKRKRSVPDNESDSVISSGKELEAGFLMIRMDEDPDITRKVIDRAKDYGAGFNYDGAHKTLLFSPHLTKKKDNLLDVVNVASEIKSIIDERNRKFVSQIDYGLGIGLGNIIAERNGNKVKFISKGNVVSSTKRIANEAKGQILASEGVKNKLLGKVKFEKQGEGLWKLESIRDRRKHDEFLKGFVNRHKDEKKS